MANTQNDQTVSAMLAEIEGGGHFALTVCAAHGTKETTWEGGGHYVELLREFDAVEGGGHEWRCCPSMVVDPWGAFDH